MITIITATYNRAYILNELYLSLKRQTSDNFEWIIVDDDSRDNTEELVGNFTVVGKNIKYIKQKHGGKHRAVNLAIKHASGEYIFIVDSDDILTDDAIESITKWISEINKVEICGVAGSKISRKGEIWGGNPIVDDDAEYIEASNLERSKFNLNGDKAEVYLKSILLKYPFPEFEGEDFLTEAVVWDKIASDGYKLRWYKKPIYICEYLDDGLTKSGVHSWEGKLKNPKGFMLYTKIFISTREEQECVSIIKSYNNVCKYFRIKLKDRYKYLEIERNKYLKLVLKGYLELK